MNVVQLAQKIQMIGKGVNAAVYVKEHMLDFFQCTQNNDVPALSGNGYKECFKSTSFSLFSS